MLEVGAGTGYYSLHVARRLEPGGALDVLDIQQEMLDQTVRRAHESGISNIVPVRGDARELPYPDNCFDAAYLNFVLGEIPTEMLRFASCVASSSQAGAWSSARRLRIPTWSGSESSERGRKQQDLGLSAGLADH
jgi:SAM-dependent methyltransferase